MEKLKDSTGKLKSLRDYTDKELYKFLDAIGTTETTILTGICAEILRRKLLEFNKL